MAVDSYSSLKTAIASHLDRDDLTSQIDDFIDLAEARHRREIRIREMLSRDPLSIGDRHVDLPTGYLEAMTLRILTDPVTVLSELNLHEMNRLRRETTGKPQYFTIHETLEFDVSPDQTYSGEVVFYKALTALSDSNTSNALLVRAPDAYLYGALTASAPFLMHDERVQVWESFYSSVKEGLMARKDLRIGPLVSRVSGATP